MDRDNLVVMIIPLFVISIMVIVSLNAYTQHETWLENINTMPCEQLKTYYVENDLSDYQKTELLKYLIETDCLLFK